MAPDEPPRRGRWLNDASVKLVLVLGAYFAMGVFWFDSPFAYNPRKALLYSVGLILLIIIVVIRSKKNGTQDR